MMAVQRFVTNRWELAGVGLLLGLWMFPDYKYFDCVMPLVAVYLGYRLLEIPRPPMAWIAGAFVGLAYFFGRNHGLYLFVSFTILIIVKSFQTKDWKRWGLGGFLGLLTGFLPLLLMFIFARDFARSYFDFIFRFGAAILPLPMPWFWKIHLFSIFQPGAFPVILFGLLFNLALFFYLFGAYRFFKNRKNPSAMDDFLLACSAVGLPYFHYMIHHADLEHLAVFIAPFWLGLFVRLSFSKLKLGMVLAAALGVSFFSITAPYHLDKMLAPYQKGGVERWIGQDRILLSAQTDDFLNTVGRILENARPGEGFMAFPHLPALYPVFGLKSPTWEIYSLFPFAKGEQERIIGQMRENNVRWALIDNTAIDGNDALRFQKTSPLVWQYLVQNYRVIPAPNGYQDCFLFFQSDGTPEF
jgi:hypothetical protein